MHPALKDETQGVERLSTAETTAGLLESGQVQASNDLYHLLLHSTSGPALDRVVNAGSAVGRKVRPTHQVENSRATLGSAPIRLLWRHACEARGV